MKIRKILTALLRKKTPEEEKAGEVSPPAFFDFSEKFLLAKTVFPYFREKIQFTFWKLFDIIIKMEVNTL